MLPACSFALSCPNSSATLLPNQDIASVIATCGPPDSEKNYSRMIQVYERSDYSINDFNVNTMYQTANYTALTTRNFYQPMLCQQITYTPNSTTTTTVACGQPYPNPQPVTRMIEVTELFYQSTYPNTLLFEDNKLVGWQ